MILLNGKKTKQRHMNLVDIFLIIIILLSIIKGWRKGFVYGLFNLIELAGSVAAAFYFYPYLANLMQKYFPLLDVWIPPLSFFIVYIIAHLIIGALLFTVIKQFSSSVHEHIVNKIFGLVPGVINGLIWAVIISALLISVPLSDGITKATQTSRFIDRFIYPAEWLEANLSPVFDKAINKTMNRMTVEPGSEKSLTLPFKSSEYKVREDLEQQMLALVNEERRKEGLSELKPDPELTEVSRKHCADMLKRGYFSHVSPDGKDPFDRMRADGVRFITAGENLAFAKTLNIAHNGLMNSPGHRANILRPQFGRLGVGVLDAGKYGLIFTQNFRN